MRRLLIATLLAAMALGAIQAASGAVISGTAGADRLRGTAFDDELYGFAGNDTLDGRAGNDLLHGGLGRDRLLGSVGSDWFAASGDGRVDTVRCGSGLDVVNAERSDRVSPDCDVVSRQLSRDAERASEAQHETQVEPDSHAFGSTIVTVFQSGRYSDGGAANIGFATSRDAGRTWRSGVLPGVSAYSKPPGSSFPVSDPAVAYDAAHRWWLAASLTSTGILISRSRDGVTWRMPVSATAGATGEYDKEWIVCDNWSTSRFRGRCYVSYMNFATNVIETRRSADGGAAGRRPAARVLGLRRARLRQRDRRHPLDGRRRQLLAAQAHRAAARDRAALDESAVVRVGGRRRGGDGLRRLERGLRDRRVCGRHRPRAVGPRCQLEPGSADPDRRVRTLRRPLLARARGRPGHLRRQSPHCAALPLDGTIVLLRPRQLPQGRRRHDGLARRRQDLDEPAAAERGPDVAALDGGHLARADAGRLRVGVVGAEPADTGLLAGVGAHARSVSAGDLRDHADADRDGALELPLPDDDPRVGPHAGARVEAKRSGQVLGVDVERDTALAAPRELREGVPEESEAETLAAAVCPHAHLRDVTGLPILRELRRTEHEAGNPARVVRDEPERRVEVAGAGVLVEPLVERRSAAPVVTEDVRSRLVQRAQVAVGAQGGDVDPCGPLRSLEPLVDVDGHQQEVAHRREAGSLEEAGRGLVFRPARRVEDGRGPGRRELGGARGGTLEQGGRDPPACAVRGDADGADDLGGRPLGPNLREARDLAVFALDDPRVERRLRPRLGETLSHLAGRGAADALMGERAAPHERGEALDVVERRSSNLHGGAPFRRGGYALRLRAAEAPEPDVVHGNLLGRTCAEE